MVRRSLQFLLVVSCALMGVQAEEPVMHSTPLLACSGLPCVDVTVDGGQGAARHVRLVLDTGDVTPILGDAEATSLGLEVKLVMDKDGKPVAGYQRTQLNGLMLGDTKLGDLRMLVMDLKAATNNHIAEGGDGFLTYPAFKDRLVRFDFVHKTLSVSAPLTSAVACKGNCGTLEYPTFGKQGPKIVLTKGFAVDGKPVSAQVDSCYTGSLLIYPNAVTKFGMDAQSHSTTKAFFTYTDGGVEMIEGKAGSLSFAGLPLVDNPKVYFATPEVHTPDELFEGTVGLGAFGAAVVTFDFHDDWISVAKAG